MENVMNLLQFAKRFKNGEFRCQFYRVQCEAGWWDWFCRDSALAGKTEYLGKKVCSILFSPKFNPEKCYVFFKNNCPAIGPLYDQFSICDIENGDVLYCFQHLNKGSHGCDFAHWEVFGENNFETPIVEGNWNAVEKYFLS